MDHSDHATYTDFLTVPSRDRQTTVRFDPLQLTDPRARPRLLRALWDALGTLDRPFNVVEQALPEPRLTQTDLQPGSPQHRHYVDTLLALTLPPPAFEPRTSSADLPPQGALLPKNASPLR